VAVLVGTPFALFWGQEDKEMIRIDVLEQRQEQVVLQVQGDLHATEMELLEGEVRRWLGPVDQVVLDLSGVPVVNGIGLERLQQWVAAPPQEALREGVRLTLRCRARCLRNLLRARGVPVEGGTEDDP
jgi:ABC-type transporter Mla MlaB component